MRTEAADQINGQLCELLKTKHNNEKGGKKMKKKTLRDFWREEDGMGTVEVILIIVVLIGLVIIFKTQLTKIVNDIFSKIASQSSSI